MCSSLPPKIQKPAQRVQPSGNSLDRWRASGNTVTTPRGSFKAAECPQGGKQRSPAPIKTLKGRGSLPQQQVGSLFRTLYYIRSKPGPTLHDPFVMIYDVQSYGSVCFGGGRSVLYKGPKFAMQARAELLGHQCQLQSNDPNGGWRIFTSYADWQTAYNQRGRFQRGLHQHDFDIIRYQQPCKPYLDLELNPKRPLPEGLTQDMVMAIVRGACIAVFKDAFCISLPPESIIFLASPNPAYFSMHVVISTHSPQLVFKTNNKGDRQGAYQLAVRVRIL